MNALTIREGRESNRSFPLFLLLLINLCPHGGHPKVSFLFELITNLFFFFMQNGKTGERNRKNRVHVDACSSDMEGKKENLPISYFFVDSSFDSVDCLAIRHAFRQCCASRADHPQWRQTIRFGISHLPSTFSSPSSSHSRQPPLYIGNNGHPFVNNNHHK